MIDEFITYLQGAGLTPDVRYAFTTEPIQDYSDELPVIMVFPMGYDAEASNADNIVSQTVNVEIACLLGCPIEEYETLLAELRAAVLGWEFTDHDAMELLRAEIEGIKGGIIWWTEVYLTRLYIRQTI